MSCCALNAAGFDCLHCATCGVLKHARGSTCFTRTHADLVASGICVDNTRPVEVTKSVKELLAEEEVNVMKQAGKRLGSGTRVYFVINGVNRGSVWYARRVYRGKEIELFYMNESDFAQDRARRDLGIWLSGCACMTSPFL